MRTTAIEIVFKHLNTGKINIITLLVGFLFFILFTEKSHHLDNVPLMFYYYYVIYCSIISYNINNIIFLIIIIHICPQ